MEEIFTDEKIINRGLTLCAVLFAYPVQGIRFVKDGLSYKGSQVDRAFSFSKLDAQLSHSNHQEQRKQTFTPQTQQPQTYEQTSSESSIGGLFDLPFVPNGTDPEDEELRKRMQWKKKKGRRM